MGLGICGWNRVFTHVLIYGPLIKTLEYMEMFRGMKRMFVLGTQQESIRIIFLLAIHMTEEYL